MTTAGGVPPKRADTLPLDMVAIILASAVAGGAGALGLDWVRAPLSLALLFIAPGHLFVAALFPQRKRDDGTRGSISPVERLGLAVVLSTFVLGAVGLLLVNTPQGLTLASTTSTVAAVAFMFGLAALARWYQTPRDERYALVVSPAKASSGAEVALLVGAIFTTGLVVVAGWFAFAGDARQSFTEFFVEGPEGLAMCYPASHNGTAYLTSARDQTNRCPVAVETVTLGIANREGEDRDYWIRVLWVGANATTGATFLDEEDVIEAHVPRLPIDIDPDRIGNATRLGYSLPEAPPAGAQRLVFQLYREPPPFGGWGEPYRTLELVIDGDAA